MSCHGNKETRRTHSTLDLCVTIYSILSKNVTFRQQVFIIFHLLFEHLPNLNNIFKGRKDGALNSTKNIVIISQFILEPFGLLSYSKILNLCFVVTL